MEYEVGDLVRVVDEPYWQCPFNWVDDMTRCCGKTFKISGKFFDEERGFYYHLDGVGWNWCESCLRPAYQDPEIPDISDEVLGDILF